MKILVLFAHPAFHKSNVNKFLVNELSKVDGITINDLYHEYPELDIDVKREQALLEEHDVVIFQFPLFWYSTPSILKEWQDLVLEHGWAFGSQGNKLKDKLFFCLVTTGGPRNAYKVGGFHNHTINQLLSPLRQTVILCKMAPLPPFVIHGTHVIEKDEIQAYKLDLLTLLRRLISKDIDPDEVAKFEYINDFITKKN